MTILGELKMNQSSNAVTKAKKAFEKKTGARGINAMVTDTTWRPFDVVYRHLGDYSEVVLDGETVKDNEKFQLVKKKKDV